MADERELNLWREAFAHFDKKGNGNVESALLGDLMRALGTNPTQEEVNKIVRDFDPRGQREITFEEFVPLMNIQKKKIAENDYASFCEGLKVFDRENNGMVSVAEIRSILCGMGERLSNAEADVLFEGMGDNNGMTNYEEFVRTVMDG